MHAIFSSRRFLLSHLVWLAMGLLCLLLLAVACKWSWSSFYRSDEDMVKIARFDMLEYRFLALGDFTALQQMNSQYSIETRTLIEDVLNLGQATAPDIDNTLLNFFQDSTLITIMEAVEEQYEDMSDVNNTLTDALERLDAIMPGLQRPEFYAQISALDQSIVVGNGIIGISLDKYLGKDFPVYKRFYDDSQRQTMNRNHIVPDCILFHVLSNFRLANYATATQNQRDIHIGKIMWITNKVVEEKFFDTPFVRQAEEYIAKHPDTDLKKWLKD